MNNTTQKSVADSSFLSNHISQISSLAMFSNENMGLQKYVRKDSYGIGGILSIPETQSSV